MRSLFRASLGFVLMVFAVAAANAAQIKRYAINLLSTRAPIKVSKYHVPAEYSRYRLYVTEFDHQGKHWYRLRLGLFYDRSEAAAALQHLKAQYRGAWLTHAEAADEAAVGAATPPAAPRVTPVPARAPTPAPVPAPRPAPRPSPSISAAAIPEAERRYVLSLVISVDPLRNTSVPELQSIKGVQVYTTKTEQNGNTWYFLRAGFFATRAEAERVLSRVQGSYPQAKVIKITRYELAEVTGRSSLATAGGPTAPVLPQTTSRNRLLEQARVAMVRGEYDSAIALYKQAIDEGDADTVRQAQELLGVAYERRGDLAEARKTYRRFLSLYPTGEDADRVQQRLVAIETATAEPQAALRQAKKRSRPTTSVLYGSFSAIYRRDAAISSTQQGETVNQESVTSYLDMTERVRSGPYDSRIRFTGSHRSEMLRNGPGNQDRVSSMYADVTQRESDWSLRIGRQSSSSGGVQGRFDGLQGGVRVSPQLRLNMVGGYPVESSADTNINQHKNFYGLSADISGLIENWEFQVYGIEQRDDGFIDRRSVGGEARYFQPGRTFFGLVDYDTYFKTLNTAMMLGTWSFNDATSINVLYDKRKSPALLLSNALQGQLDAAGLPITTVKALAATYTDPQLRQLALDRTADSQSVMVGLAHTLSDRYRVTMDLTTSQIGGTPASGGVAATPATGTQYYLSTQLIGRSMLWQDDISIIGLTATKTETLKAVGMNFNSRVPRSYWQFNPRVSLEYRDDSGIQEQYVVFSPSMIVDYQRWRNHTLEFEAGGQYTSRANVPQGYYISLSYRWDF